jgi:hypothetical protein
VHRELGRCGCARRGRRGPPLRPCGRSGGTSGRGRRADFLTRDLADRQVVVVGLGRYVLGLVFEIGAIVFEVGLVVVRVAVAAFTVVVEFVVNERICHQDRVVAGFSG